MATKSRIRHFTQSFVGLIIVMVIAKPIIGALVAFSMWKLPTDWAAFFGLTLENVRFTVAIAMGWALLQQVGFKEDKTREKGTDA